MSSDSALLLGKIRHHCHVERHITNARCYISLLRSVIVINRNVNYINDTLVRKEKTTLVEESDEKTTPHATEKLKADKLYEIHGSHGNTRIAAYVMSNMENNGESRKIHFISDSLLRVKGERNPRSRGGESQGYNYWQRKEL